MVVLRRLFAWCALVAFTGTFGLGAGLIGHGGPDDDAACRQDALYLGHAQAQIGTGTATSVPAPAHCPFCHWQRTLRGGSIVSADLSPAPLNPIDTVVTLTTRMTGSTAVAERPSRAPPSSLFS